MSNVPKTEVAIGYPENDIAYRSGQEYVRVGVTGTTDARERSVMVSWTTILTYTGLIRIIKPHQKPGSWGNIGGSEGYPEIDLSPENSNLEDKLTQPDLDFALFCNDKADTNPVRIQLVNGFDSVNFPYRQLTVNTIGYNEPLIRSVLFNTATPGLLDGYSDVMEAVSERALSLL